MESSLLEFLIVCTFEECMSLPPVDMWYDSLIIVMYELQLIKSLPWGNAHGHFQSRTFLIKNLSKYQKQ